MKTIMMAAPFEVNGRYEGGITAVANNVYMKKLVFEQNGYGLVKFETCRVYRESADNTVNVSNLKNSWLIFSELVREIITSGVDILYYHTSIGLALLKDLIAISHAKCRTGVKNVLHIHYAEYNKIMTGKPIIDKIILFLMKHFVDRVVFLSEETRKEFVAHGIADERTEVIYNFSMLSASERDISVKLAKKDISLNLLFIGSIDDRKGIFEILDVLNELDEDNYKLHICGASLSDEDEQRFKRAIAKQEGRIQFHGYVKGEDKCQMYLNTDVLMLPSHEEGLPLVILEAMSMGCLILTTNVGAIPEIVKAQNGFVIHPGDHEALKKAILDVLHMKKDQMQSIQRYNYEESKQYSLDAFVGSIIAVCKKCRN